MQDWTYSISFIKSETIYDDVFFLCLNANLVTFLIIQTKRKDQGGTDAIIALIGNTCVAHFESNSVLEFFYWLYV